MKTTSRLLTTLVVATVTSAPMMAAHAESDTAATATELTAPAADTTAVEVPGEALLVSELGRSVVSGIHYAKQALDDGNDDAAKSILGEVSGMLGGEDGAMIVKTGDGFALPIDKGVGVPEGFEPTEEQVPAFAAADLLMQSGDINGVVSTLNDAGVDLIAQVVVLPYESTVDGVTQAVADIDAGKLDDAGSALEAMLTAVKVESYQADELPSQGYGMNEVTG